MLNILRLSCYSPFCLTGGASGLHKYLSPSRGVRRSQEEEQVLVYRQCHWLLGSVALSSGTRSRDSTFLKIEASDSKARMLWCCISLLIQYYPYTEPLFSYSRTSKNASRYSVDWLVSHVSSFRRQREYSGWSHFFAGSIHSRTQPLLDFPRDLHLPHHLLALRQRPLRPFWGLAVLGHWSFQLRSMSRYRCWFSHWPLYCLLLWHRHSSSQRTQPPQ